MKQISWIIFLGFLMVSCNQNQSSNVISKTDDTSKFIKADSMIISTINSNADCLDFKIINVKEQADTLTKYYKLTIDKQADRQRCDNMIFCSFPDSFKDMQELFGYDDSKGAASLYDYPLGENIIKYFGQMTTIPKDKYYDKYINICIGGIWQADNIREGFGIHERLINDSEAICSRLTKKTDKEIKSVFRFIFDGPHPKNDNNQMIYNQLLPNIDKFDKRLSNLLAESYNQLMKEVPCDGE